MTDKDFVFDCDTFADEGVAGNFAASANFCAFLNLNKGADFRVVADFAAVQIGEAENADILAQLDVCGDFLEWLHY